MGMSRRREASTDWSKWSLFSGGGGLVVGRGGFQRGVRRSGEVGEGRRERYAW